jgi:hypothetical protein
MWRNARFRLRNPLSISRLTDAGDMLRYSAACLILSARGLIGAQAGDVITYLIYIPERTLVKLKFTYVNSSAQPYSVSAQD